MAPADQGEKPDSLPAPRRLKDPWRFAEPVVGNPALRPYKGPSTVEEEAAEFIESSEEGAEAEEAQEE